MPGFDRTGPRGMGPMTGGRRGLCGAGRAANNTGYGYGFGRGRGRGFGPGYGQGRGFNRFSGMPTAPYYGPAPYPANAGDEAAMLREDARNLEKELQAVNNRISELESASSG